jgi:hypothetical protein
LPKDAARTLLRTLEVFRPAFRPAAFARWLLVMTAWLLCQERHAITECLVVSGAAGLWEHSPFHRVFSRRRWNLDTLGQRWLRHVLAFLDARGVPWQIVVDDTLGTHKGPYVFGLGNHLDAVRSTRRKRVFAFGHVWVVCSLVVSVPFSSRPWALPILFRLYRTKKDCAANGGVHRTKTLLARDLINLLLTWLPDTSFELLLDQGYTNRTVLRGLPARVCVLGSLDLRAALSNPAGRQLANGRHSPIGQAWPTRQAWALDPASPWQTSLVMLYGAEREVEFKTCVAQWWHVLGAQPVRVVMIRCVNGALRTFLCTDVSVTVEELLAKYARRWAIEVFFFEVKQFLGLGESRARTELAVCRMAPCVGLLYGVVVVWFWEQSEHGLEAVIPLRPWYGHKTSVSFEDVLRTARRALGRRAVIEQVDEVAPLRRGQRASVTEDVSVPRAA